MEWGDRKCCKDLIKPAFHCAYSGTGKPVAIPVQRYPGLLHVNNKADFRLSINAMPVFCAAWNGWLESQLAWDSALCPTAWDTSASYVLVPLSFNAVGALVLCIYRLHSAFSEKFR